jgi:hypothetical protein
LARGSGRGPVPSAPAGAGESAKATLTINGIVPVFQKEPAGKRTVCYCFDVTEPDVRREIHETGNSTAAERITDLVKAERCACEVRNPQGVCCLGNVTTVVMTLLTEMVPAD